MIRSMTGFGAAVAEIMGCRARLEIKTLNNRHREYFFRAPHYFGRVEDPLKKIINRRVSRGRIEVVIQIESARGGPGGPDLAVNIGAARQIYEGLAKLSEELQLGEKVTLGHLLCADKHFIAADGLSLDLLDPDLLVRDMEALAERALDQLVAMRESEGKSHEADISARLEGLRNSLGSLKAIAANVPLIVTKRYQARLEELAETIIDPDRLAQEAAILAEKLDITEEITRFAAHVKSFGVLLETAEPVGRRMEFLLQELVREANTMGSKSQSLPITEIVLCFKSELEKIREQALNIE